MAWRPSSSSSNTRWACGSSACPAGVNATLRVLRSNSVTPSSRSSFRIVWLSGDWASRSRAAAQDAATVASRIESRLEPPFELPDRPRQWRLRYTEPLSGPPEVQLLGDGDERLQPPDLHADSLGSCVTRPRMLS